MEKDKVCCFTGHRVIPDNRRENLRWKLNKSLLTLVQKGVCRFRAGGAGGFDSLAAETVIALRETYPQMELILMLPLDSG